MNERIHFFIKIYLSRFILERVDVGCVWEMNWRPGQTVILTQSSSRDHSSTFSSSWLGLLNRGSLRAASPQSASWFSCWNLVPNWLKPSVCWLYYCLTYTCFSCSSAYLHRCISWLKARSRVNMSHLYAYEVYVSFVYSHCIFGLGKYFVFEPNLRPQRSVPLVFFAWQWQSMQF